MNDLTNALGDMIDYLLRTSMIHQESKQTKKKEVIEWLKKKLLRKNDFLLILISLSDYKEIIMALQDKIGRKEIVDKVYLLVDLLEKDGYLCKPVFQKTEKKAYRLLSQSLNEPNLQRNHS